MTSTELALFSDNQVDLIKRTVCRGADDDELALFLYQCDRLALDPLSRQVYAIKRWDSDQKRNVMVIQVGIDGFRCVADRKGGYRGQRGPYWCGPLGEWSDVWLNVGHPEAAKVIVLRNNAEFTAVALYKEYVQTVKDKETGELRPNAMWSKMPAAMLAKCAEALALRKAFPNDLSGIYTPDEFPSGHDAQGEPAMTPRAPVTAPVLVHETPARVPSAEAKRALIDAYESRGWDPLQAQAKAVELWGDRKKEPIDSDDLSELIGEALNQQGPNDDAYQFPPE